MASAAVGSVGRAMGIDIGTTSVKVCVVDINKKVVDESRVVHNAWIRDCPASHREQNVQGIFDAISSALRSLRDPLTSSVASVCVTGQMHGIVLWNSERLLKGELCCSSLSTWMDAKVPTDFIASLPSWECGTVHQGYGMVTLAWMFSNNQVDPRWDCCGTIMDLYNCYITRSRRARMGVQNAFSWGYCNWNGDWSPPSKLIPGSILPEVVSTGTQIGVVANPDVGLPLDARVFSSLGDLQSTLFPLLSSGPSAAVLNLGTSAQLCFACDRELVLLDLLVVPFFHRARLIVAASLNGGNAIELIARKIVEWASELCGIADLQVDYAKMVSLLENASGGESNISILPTFLGERYNSTPSTVTGIRRDTSLAEILLATAEGVVTNLCRLMPLEIFRANGIRRVLLAGNATKAPFYNAARKLFAGFDVETPPNASASYGAALFALQVASASLDCPEA